MIAAAAAGTTQANEKIKTNRARKQTFEKRAKTK